MPKGMIGRKDSCSKCDKKIDRAGRYCKACHAAYARVWRKTHKLTPPQKKKNDIRRKVNMRVKRGLLVPYPCEICQKEPAEAHHDDYNKPYCVRWLCRIHHLEHHKNEREKLK